MTEFARVNSSENISEAVNQTVNATGQAAGGGDGGGFIGFLTDPFVAGILILAALGLTFIYGVKRGKGSGSGDEDDYEATPMEERLDEKMLNPASEFGFPIGKPLYYEKDQLFKKKLGNLETVYTSTDKVEDDEDSNGNEEFLTLIIGPTGFVDSWKANMGHENPRKNSFKTVIEIPEEVKTEKDVKEDVLEDRGDYIAMKDIDLEEVKGSGYYRAADAKTFTHMKERVTSSVMEDGLETWSNIAENLQALNIKNTAAWKFFDMKMGAIGDYKKDMNDEEELSGSD
jgi:hypothetical protein